MENRRPAASALSAWALALGATATGASALEHDVRDAPRLRHRFRLSLQGEAANEVGG